MIRPISTVVSLAALAAQSLGAAAPSTISTPTSVDAFDTAAMLSGDCRIVIMGDSFASTTFKRVFCGFLNFWEPTPLTALYVPGGIRTKLGQGTPLASPYTDIAAESPTGYETLISTGVSEFVTLPVRGILEFEGGPSLTLGTNDSLVGYSVLNATLDSMPQGRMFLAGDQATFRGLFWAPTNTPLMHNGLGLAIGGVTLDQFDPASEARQFLHLGETPDALGRPAAPGHFNAFARDIEFTVMQGNPDALVTLRSTTGPIATGSYVHSVGGVYTKIDGQGGERIPGVYYSALADSSWAYGGFGLDGFPEKPFDKVFTQSQFTHWLDVTTLELDQPVIFVYYLAAEPDFAESAPARIEAMVDQAAAAATDLGLTTVRHLLVMPHLHRIIGLGDIGVTRTRIEEQRDAMFEIASRRPEVSAVSIYDATDGVLLDGSSEARDWLRTHAPAPFEYANQSIDLADGPMLGDLLDSPDLHPTNEHAAAFYSKAFVDALLAPLELDFNHDGILDNGDITGFIDAFLGADLSADMNHDGILDNGDIVCFVERFLAEV